MKLILFLIKINYFNHHKFSTYLNLSTVCKNHHDTKLNFLENFQQNILFVNLIIAKIN